MRCRMHGGAKGSGAPKGNHNALKHGTYTKEALQRRAALRHLCETLESFSRRTVNDMSV